MENGYAEDAGRKEPKFGTMQDGDGYDPCAVCGSYPVVNVRGEYDGHETFIAECPKCGNRAEYGFVRLLPYDSYYISRLMSNWNDKQKEIAEKEMRHIEEANRKDGTETRQEDEPSVKTVSTEGLGYEPCFSCGANPVLEIKHGDGRIQMTVKCPNCPINQIFRVFDHEDDRHLQVSELITDWNEVQRDFAESRERRMEEADKNDGADELSEHSKQSEQFVKEIAGEFKPQSNELGFNMGMMGVGDGYAKCPKCLAYPHVLLDGDGINVRCPSCGVKLLAPLDERFTSVDVADRMLQSAWGASMELLRNAGGDGLQPICDYRKRHFIFGTDGREFHIMEMQDRNGETLMRFAVPFHAVSKAAGNVSQAKIADMCDRLKNLLLEKNRKYGDSALNPCRVFSKSDAVEQLKVRMDDKLSRIRNAQSDEDEDVYMDLAGYLVLMMVAREDKRRK